MRIAYLSSSMIPSRSANSIHVMKMCAALAGLGHEVSLVAREGDVWVESDHAIYGVEECFEILKCPRPPRVPGEMAFQALAAAVKLRGVAPDLIYGRDVLSVAAVARRGIPIVYEAHSVPSWRYRSVVAWLLRRPNFARLVVISDALRREYEQLHASLSGDKVLVAHDAADRPSDRPAPALTKRLRGRNGRLRVGYIGHLYPGKGIDVVAALAERMSELDFHVVGGTEEEIHAWQERARGSSNLIFHGFVAPALTDAYRRAMDVLLAPYHKRNVHVSGGGGDISRWMSPLKIFEYMAAGKPIVASDLPVLREVLTDDVDALLVEPEDLDAWQRALRRLVDPALRQRLGRRALARFEAQHTWDLRAQRVLDGL